jgi:hypothetical protein
VTFTAPRDGLYWFAVQTVRKDGRREPVNLDALAPVRKVYVNTERKPVKAQKFYDELQREAEDLRKAVEQLQKRIKELESDRAQEDWPEGVVAGVTSTGLFQGDARRLGNHFDFIGTACIKVDFKAKKLPYSEDPVEWRNGKVHEQKELARGSFTEPSEVTFSLREVKERKGKAKYAAVGAVPGERWAADFEKPQIKFKPQIACQQNLERPVEVKRDEPVAVWLRYEGKGALPYSAEGVPLDAKAKEVEWGWFSG